MDNMAHWASLFKQGDISTPKYDAEQAIRDGNTEYDSWFK
jgi:hypothetical protein